jgi:hypothetical protein
VPPVRVEAGDGEIVTEVTTRVEPVTVTAADADFVESALLIAVTVSEPALTGAVYRPAALTVPRAAFQVTLWSVAVPCTEAENWAAAPVDTVEEAGEIVTELTDDGVAAPIPVRGTTTELALALVMMVRVPLTVPAEVAPNMTVKFLLWPEEREKGSVKPDIVKPAPAMLTWLTSNAAVPELVAVTLCVEPEVPTVLLRDTLLGVTVSCAVPC